MNTTLSSKNELRKYALKKRVMMSKGGITEINSKKIVSDILNSKEFAAAKNIALYYPIKGEINLLSLLKVTDKNFYLPKCTDNNLEFAKYEKTENLKEGLYGIPEPKGDSINPDILDIIYIPALVANKKGYRLGYGKGYYDRFFSKYSNLKAKKIIVISNSLISDNFIQDANDIKCDSILSESCLIFA